LSEESFYNEIKSITLKHLTNAQDIKDNGDQLKNIDNLNMGNNSNRLKEEIHNNIEETFLENENDIQKNDDPLENKKEEIQKITQMETNNLNENALLLNEAKIDNINNKDDNNNKKKQHEESDNTGVNLNNKIENKVEDNNKINEIDSPGIQNQSKNIQESNIESQRDVLKNNNKESLQNKDNISEKVQKIAENSEEFEIPSISSSNKKNLDKHQKSPKNINTAKKGSSTLKLPIKMNKIKNEVNNPNSRVMKSEQKNRNGKTISKSINRNVEAYSQTESYLEIDSVNASPGSKIIDESYSSSKNMISPKKYFTNLYISSNIAENLKPREKNIFQSLDKGKKYASSYNDYLKNSLKVKNPNSNNNLQKKFINSHPISSVAENVGKLNHSIGRTNHLITQPHFYDNNISENVFLEEESPSPKVNDSHSILYSKNKKTLTSKLYNTYHESVSIAYPFSKETQKYNQENSPKMISRFITGTKRKSVPTLPKRILNEKEIIQKNLQIDESKFIKAKMLDTVRSKGGDIFIIPQNSIVTVISRMDEIELVKIAFQGKLGLFPIASIRIL